MVSFASTNFHQRLHISAALSAYPALAAQTIETLDLPLKPSDYRPIRLEAHFNGRLILLLEAGQITYEATGYPPDYRPKVMVIYGDSELLFVRIGPEILLNRLPVAYTPNWRTYAAQ